MFLFSQIQAQIPTQTIRGRVLDKETKQTIIGASVFIKDSDPLIASSTDIEGNFVLEKVPVGRQVISAQYMGYNNFSSDNFIVSAAKETFMEIEMIESVQTTEEVEVNATSGNSGGNRPLNELSVVSTRSFSVEETQRYAASINDPGRMVMAFPGVQANQDTENDIIVRGNSAVGVLWRLEGMDIANPNHFARPATSGGGITMFSASLLSNSDFSTGAFAAEYGNAFSGVFDVRFRKGNLMNREATFRIGLVGIDLATEGPIKKGRSSYLINYRYSTLGILGLMGIYVVRDNVTNNFQDLSFNLHFSSPDNKNLFTVFGVGGLSKEHWWMRDTARWENSLDYVWDRNDANLGVLGMTYTRLLDEKSFLKVTAGGWFSEITDFQMEPRSEADSVYWLERNDFKNTQLTVHAVYSRKITNQFRIKAGIISNYHIWDLEYGLYNGVSGYQNYLGSFTPGGLMPLTSNFYQSRPKTEIPLLRDKGTGLTGGTLLQQAYFQTSYRPIDKLTLNAGVHAMYLALNNTYSVDPRLSLRYAAAAKTNFTLAYGIHSKALPWGTYMLTFTDSMGNSYQPNKNLKLTGAHHLIGGFEQMFGKNFRLQIELYYQYLYNIPISTDTSSSFWFYNLRDNYGTDPMVTKGKGQNYGIDMTFEKSFGKGFFFIFTSSLRRSTFKAWGNEFRPTRLDNIYSTSLMATKEFTFKKGGVLQIGIKTFLRGGLHHASINLPASIASGAFVEDQTAAYNAQFPTYFRLDGRIAYRKDHKNLSYVIAIDLQNATNQINPRQVEYDRNLQKLVLDPNSGRTPVLSFQIDF